METCTFFFVEQQAAIYHRLAMTYEVITTQIGDVNPLSANITKYSKILKQFVGKLLTICLSVFDHFVGLVLTGLKKMQNELTASQLELYRRCFVKVV